SPPGITHMSGLDPHLFATVAHQASLHSSLNRGDVLEIQGPASSGKTHFIYHLTSICLLPDHLDGHRLGGWNKAAVVFDCDDAFDVIRFKQLLDSQISHLIARSSAGASESGPVRADEQQREKLVTDCLQHLHVFRPTSTLQLAATILNLPSYHLENDPDVEIGLLAVDSISAFYWPDRFTVEQLCLGENISLKDLGSLNPLHHVLKALQRFRLSHGVITVLTNWGLHPLATPSGPSPFYRQHLRPFPAPFV
ncbi:hypothetical protein PUNSTDRAFT_38523, partial [Punctularia strigosozonata HHB-11173 SS5]|uniref:uncharacterized protein n=1 Tax=Punctularia strigosozonata (strain HHB-11173) TaxID=741275 RepID=UPI000441714F